jgi:hypothetical protein
MRKGHCDTIQQLIWLDPIGMPLFISSIFRFLLLSQWGGETYPKVTLFLSGFLSYQVFSTIGFAYVSGDNMLRFPFVS